MVRPEREDHAAVLGILRDLRGIEPLKELFWSQLNYRRVNEPISRQGWGQPAGQGLAESPLLFAAGGADDAFHVIYARLDSPKLLRGFERPVVARLLQHHPYALFAFSNDARDRWHFVNHKLVREEDTPENRDPKVRRLFRRITVGPEERLRTASERMAMLDLAGMDGGPFGLSPLAIQQRHDEAFDVEAVTKQFFEDYKAGFEALREDLRAQTNDTHWAHDCALQLLNRCMFLYFVQRKRWLGDDPEFLATFWKAYNAAGQPPDTFFPKWLSVLFFQAFNNRFHGGHRQFPDDIRNALQLAPYLNGGLFTENDLDRGYSFNVTDAGFRKVFDFLEKYNFTIAEDSPLDQEVAVDPEMIGKVYESLVNVSEEADKRGEAGIFYTPRTEIDLMCRLALVDNLASNLGSQHKNLFYEAVFALEQQEKHDADEALHKAGLWPRVAEHVRGITVVDPACGSGSFLVGMLHILDDLQGRAAGHLGGKEDAYERKKRIIGRNLYGVDVMEWACHVAELRLWLALIIDADIAPEERTVRAEALLPHFTFKIRCGDSLVQEVGGVNLSRRRGSTDIPRQIKARLTRLQKAKLAFYDGHPLDGFKTDSSIRSEEVAIFRDLIDHRARAAEEEAKRLMRIQAETTPARQMRLDGTRPDVQRSLPQEERDRQIDAQMEEAKRLKAQQVALRHPKDVPFVWDIGFAEVMESEAGGFDIAIGNPPYVRQESIADPRLPREDVTTANKKDYKAKLARSVYQAWPGFFGYKPSADAPSHKIDAKSDLYIYFYFHGLSLLNDRGSFIFITSNSWLDVGYGKDLQEFLLRRGHVKMVIDNQVKRSFASADINTVIALLSRPSERRDEGLARAARFIMFKVPFEQVLSPIIFEEIEDAVDRRSTNEYRICCMAQDKLYEEGGEIPEELRPPRTGKTPTGRGPLIKVAKYIGNKWGGKYLRAPDIYWTVLEKGKDKLIRLGDVAEVRFGIKTGANDFFYLDRPTAEEWNIEKRFLRPVILRPGEITMPEVRAEHLSMFILVADQPRKALNGTNVERYIRWGEERGFHRSATCAARAGRNGEWYRLRPRPPAALVLPIINKMRLVLGINEAKAQVDDNCVEIRVASFAKVELVAALMLGSFNFLLRHSEGRSYGRMLKVQTYEAARLLLHDPRTVPSGKTGDLLQAFNAIRSKRFEWLREEMESPERVRFDRAWLGLHGFDSEKEQGEVLDRIHQAVRRICEDMSSQEQDWLGEKPAVRSAGNPQDHMKGKRKSSKKRKR